ncbi:dehydrogenase [Lithospermum erythrorhizon]|uniref:Dehydrogenase n=1 Tax=Lithospermum erythrorhizon TaxID=34254 RepID=A0AAV3NNN5_LITER
MRGQYRRLIRSAKSTWTNEIGQKKWDALIIGGGHNGLIAAAYLARSGLSVAVLERRHIIGGAAVTEELIPGFKFSRCSYLQSLLRPDIIK